MQLRDMKQSELAKKLGIAPQSVSTYANGQCSPDPQTLAEISRALRVSSDYLLGLSASYSADVTTREICSRTNLTDETLEALKNIQSVDHGSGVTSEQLTYYLNRVICSLCSDNIPLLVDITRYSLYSLSLRPAFGGDSKKGWMDVMRAENLLDPQNLEYSAFLSWKIANDFAALINSISPDASTFRDSFDMLQRAGALPRSPGIYPPVFSFSQYGPPLKSYLSEAIQQDLERMNHGIRKKETE